MCTSQATREVTRIALRRQRGPMVGLATDAARQLACHRTKRQATEHPLHAWSPAPGLHARSNHRGLLNARKRGEHCDRHGAVRHPSLRLTHGCVLAAPFSCLPSWAETCFARHGRGVFSRCSTKLASCEGDRMELANVDGHPANPSVVDGPGRHSYIPSGFRNERQLQGASSVLQSIAQGREGPLDPTPERRHAAVTPVSF